MPVTIIANPFKKLHWKRDGFRRPWVSRKYKRDNSGVIYHDLRCDICGKWYTYSTLDIPRIIRQGRWNFSKLRPLHCGNSMCEEYEIKSREARIRAAQEKDEYYQNLFKRLKKRKLVV